jgi:hypothetical protein
MRIAVVVFVVLILACSSVHAQSADCYTAESFSGVPGYIGLFVDSLADESCTFPTPISAFEMWIWCEPGSDGMIGAEFKLEYPGNVFWDETTLNPGIAVLLGDLSSGISLVFEECQTDWVWTHRQTLYCMDSEPSYISIEEHPDIGKIEFATCASGYPIEEVTRHGNLEINMCSCPDLYPPALAWARAVNLGEVEASFGEPVTEASAENLANYYVCNTHNPSETIPIASITLHPDFKVITVNLALPMIEGIEYYLCARNIVDRHGNILDWTSCEHFGYSPDLTVSGLSIEPDSIYLETPSIEAFFKIKNIGVWPSGPFRVAARWYNGTPDTLDIMTVNYEGLAAGDSLEEAIEVPVPPITSATNVLLIEVDDNNHVNEKEEGNNRQNRGIHVYLPDLHMTNGSVVLLPNVIEEGCAPIKVRYTIRNIGIIDAGPFPVSIWIFPKWYTDRKRLLERFTLPGLAAGAALVDSTYIVPPRDVDFDNTIIFAVNDPRTILEHSMADNEHWPRLPSDAPRILSITDTPNDVGGFVRLVVFRCRADAAGVQNPISRYDVILENTGAVVGSRNASGQNNYWVTVPTIGDSSGTGIPWSFYHVRAVRPIAGTPDTMYYYSCPDSGYSVCNAIATFLKSYDVSVKESSVEITWQLTQGSDDVDFLILRESKKDGRLEELDPTGIQTENFSFRFADGTIDAGERYRYRVEYVDAGGRHILFESEYVGIPALPLTLFQNQPNPFNPSTTIRYYLPEACRVKLDVFGVQGWRIATLIETKQGKGSHAVEWRGLDESGNTVSSGIYFYRLTVGKNTLSRKMVLLR